MKVKAAMYGADKAPHIKGFVCGLGGREVLLKDVKQMADKVISMGQNDTADNEVDWIGVRG